MSYKIIVDSCGELTKEMKESGIFESVALGIEVGGHHIVDDETFDQADFLKKSVRKSGMPKIILPIPGTIYGKLSV